jgi:hypothetical protein
LLCSLLGIRLVLSFALVAGCTGFMVLRVVCVVVRGKVLYPKMSGMARDVCGMCEGRGFKNV